MQFKTTIDKINAIKNQQYSALENTKQFLQKIKEVNNRYNIYLEINEEKALKRAKEIDEKIKKGEDPGRLAGLCFSIKSVISVKGFKASCASKVLENYTATFNADVVEKIIKEGGIILGIVNNDEFACGSSGETSAFGPTINPACPSRIPGGSSSGSAAAVAARLCDISIGTDTGGSIRNPASHCGVIGIKPTYGRVSRFGLIDLSMSLDQPGPLCQDIDGCALVLEVIAGKSERDPTTVNLPVDKYSDIKIKNRYKIGIIKEFEEMITEPLIKEAYLSLINKLKEKHETREMSFQYIKLAVQTYYPIVYSEFFSGTRKFDGLKYGIKIEDFCGAEVLRRILGGREISKSEFKGTYYRKALKVKNLIRNEFKKAFEEVDFIITPVTPKLPHKLGEKLTALEMYAYDAFTIPVNLGGICGGVVNLKKFDIEGEKVPVGIQVLAGEFNEKTMFEGMKVVEEITKNV